MRYEKWDALGNTYVLVERVDSGVLTPGRAERLCEVVGSDGVLEVVERGGAQAQVVIWNPDGSIAEMSGNGMRIAAAWLGEVSGSKRVTVSSGGRDLTAVLHGAGAVEIDLGLVAVGVPEALDVNGEEVEVTPVSVGNPHAVIRRRELVREDLLRLGPAIETHPRFPARTNVQLMAVVDERAIDVLVWERGAGETSASGSSSVAAAAVAVERGWCASPVTVRLPGGELSVALAAGRATLVGPVVRVTTGTIDV